MIVDVKKAILHILDCNSGAGIFSEEEIDVSECDGRILASSAISCPPAIPIVVCGEIIDENAIKCFEYYGIKKCRIIKNYLA